MTDWKASLGKTEHRPQRDASQSASQLLANIEPYRNQRYRRSQIVVKCFREI